MPLSSQLQARESSLLMNPLVPLARNSLLSELKTPKLTDRPTENSSSPLPLLRSTSPVLSCTPKLLSKTLLAEPISFNSSLRKVSSQELRLTKVSRFFQELMMRLPLWDSTPSMPWPRNSTLLVAVLLNGELSSRSPLMDALLSKPSKRTHGVWQDMELSAKLTDLSQSLSLKSLSMVITPLKSARRSLKESSLLSSRLSLITTSSGKDVS